MDKVINVLYVNVYNVEFKIILNFMVYNPNALYEGGLHC